jgi:hypothetical protein
LAANVNDTQVALRPIHLKYLVANKDRIFCGSPTINQTGQFEIMMSVILNAADLSSAELLLQEIDRT